MQRYYFENDLEVNADETNAVQESQEEKSEDKNGIQWK